MSDTNDTIVTNSYNGGPSELDEAASAFIKEYAATPQDEAPDEVAPPVIEAKDETVAPVTPGTAAPNTVEDPRGLERLVEREVALRERDTAIAAREARMAELEARAAKALPDDILSKLEYSPEETLKAMGVDPEQLVRQVIANRLGDQADPSVKQTIESAKVRKEINELRATLAEQQRRAAAGAFVAQVEAGAREYVMKGVGENVPTVTAVAKANPDRVYREIMEEIAKDAQSRAAKDPNGDVLPYAEAAKRVEARWAEFKAILSPAPAPAGNPTTTASTSNSTAIASGAKTTSTTVKSPDRPIAPWLQKGQEEENGIKAAIAEYNRVEAARTR
jgi:hypothetical protein